MQSLDGQHFDTVIIGAGMSGLAAGIRLAMFDQKVLILERHNAPGGLNSFYSIDGRKYDVGLHALTNFVPEGTKGTPLAKLFRQLRIDRQSFDLHPQKQSRILFSDVSLRFSNDFKLLESEVAAQFPDQIDGFLKLVAHIRSFDELKLSSEHLSTRSVLSEYLSSPLLIDMLMCPMMYYGSAEEHDMDFKQFVILFKSIFLEGFARPYEGVRQIVRVLLDKYRSLGGVRKMKCGVQKLEVREGSVSSILLDSGESISAGKVISSAGWVETLRLCSENPPQAEIEAIGPLSFIETMTVFTGQPRDYGWDDTIIFFNDSQRFEYACPEGLVDSRSGVICFPNNYDYQDKTLPEGIIRTTAIANYTQWANLSEESYREQKEKWFNVLRDKVFGLLPPSDTAKFDSNILATDMFTPRTVGKFTGHLKGAVYGTPDKQWSGQTPVDNLFICGSDQGYLGIVGAMLSGISMANLHVLSKN